MKLSGVMDLFFAQNLKLVFSQKCAISMFAQTKYNKSKHFFILKDHTSHQWIYNLVEWLNHEDELN